MMAQQAGFDLDFMNERSQKATRRFYEDELPEVQSNWLKNDDSDEYFRLI